MSCVLHVCCFTTRRLPVCFATRSVLGKDSLGTSQERKRPSEKQPWHCFFLGRPKPWGRGLFPFQNQGKGCFSRSAVGEESFGEESGQKGPSSTASRAFKASKDSRKPRRLRRDKEIRRLCLQISKEENPPDKIHPK